MTLGSQVHSWMRAMMGRTRMENEMDAELRFHMQAYAEDLQRKGVGREEAMRRARIEFGGVERAKEECRDACGVSFTESLLQDLRYGARALRKSPGFTAIAVLTLALGIGANTAIFSVVNAILLHPLAYKDADRLATILNDGNGPISVANYIDWREQSHSFGAMGAAEYWSPNLIGVDQPENIRGHKITCDLFPLLGAQPLFGRLFTEADDRAGSEHEVILSYRLWQRRFSSDRNVIGKVIRLNGEAYSVVGVMPRDFQFAPFWATNAELWVPIAFGDRVHKRAGNSLRVFGRLKPAFDAGTSEMPTWLTVIGVVKDAKQGDWAAKPDEEVYLAAFQNRQFLGAPESHSSYITLVARTTGDTAALTQALKDTVWSFDRNLPISQVLTMDAVVADANAQPRFEMLLLGILAVVALLLAAVGIYGVMSYAVSRHTHEIGIRVSLGASRADIVLLVIRHGMVLALIGSAAGIVGALGLSRLMKSLLYGVKPIDPLIFGGVTFLLMIVAIAASYLPARRAMLVDPTIALRYE
jgi:hypothetical protein